MIHEVEIQGLFPDIYQEGFSAYKASQAVTGNAMLTGWDASAPFFSSSSFNATGGIYTAPVTGVYAMQATVSYVTTSVITSQLGANSNPTFTISRISPTTADLVTGQIPVFYTNLLILNLRTILGGSTITMSGIVQLSEGQTFGLFYNADGMTLSLTLQKVQWAIYRLG